MSEPAAPAGAPAPGTAPGLLRSHSGPWDALALTVPIFVAYHICVIFLPVRNAADVVTRELVALAKNDLFAYGGITLGLGTVIVGVLLLLGRGHSLRWDRFVLVLVEGAVYAVAMRLVAAWVVGKVFLGGGIGERVVGLVMSLGAGLYEEIAFRAVLFGLGARLLAILFPMPVPMRTRLVTLAWAIVAAALFSGWHHVGDLGEPFDARTFVFRWVCGLVFTAIYVFRGFAPAVWTHVVYDVWVLVL
jgi:hypothetical protein